MEFEMTFCVILKREIIKNRIIIGIYLLILLRFKKKNYLDEQIEYDLLISECFGLFICISI